MPPLAAGARRTAGEEPLAGTRLGTAAAERLVLDAMRLRDAVLFREVVFREAVFREPEARLRAAAPVRREPVAPLRPAAALRFPLAARGAVLLRLAAAARFVFFLPRGGILLLRELGSQSAAGVANLLPAFGQ